MQWVAQFLALLGLTLSIMEFVKGKDVFVSLPTGFGKSLCYILLPIVFDRLRKVDKKSIALVVSPLIALMQDQVSAATAMGVSAIHITDKHATKSIVKQSVKNGEYQIVSGEVYRDAQLPLRLHRFMFVSTC